MSLHPNPTATQELTDNLMERTKVFSFLVCLRILLNLKESVFKNHNPIFTKVLMFEFLFFTCSFICIYVHQFVGIIAFLPPCRSCGLDSIKSDLVANIFIHWAISPPLLLLLRWSLIVCSPGWPWICCGVGPDLEVLIVTDTILDWLDSHSLCILSRPLTASFYLRSCLSAVKRVCTDILSCFW